MQFTQDDKHLIVKFQGFQALPSVPQDNYYSGSYRVTPKVKEQTLETKQKFLTDNIVVYEIPYYDVSNNSGGSTVYIAKEVDINGNI